MVNTPFQHVFCRHVHVVERLFCLTLINIQHCLESAATTGNETVATAGDETAATGGVMYADEGPYTIDVRHVEAMVGTTREAADGDRVRRGRDGDETGGPRDETGDKKVATAGDKRDGGDRWGNVYGRRGVRI